MKKFGILVLLVLFISAGLVITACPEPDTTTVSVTGVTLDKEEITLFEEDTYTLTATVEPDNATNQGVSWGSDNENVATVSDTGEVTAVAKGTATITVITTDGSFEDTCTVTVKPLPTSIEVTTVPTKTVYKIGEELDLEGLAVTATFSDNSEDEVEITSDNISGFDSTTPGEKTITVTYGEHEATFKVTVFIVVTFYLNGGNWEGDTNNKTVEQDTVTTVAKPDDPTKTGTIANIFDGWYDESLENAFDFDTLITDNITLYAKWEFPYKLGDTGPGGGKIFYRSEEGFTMTDDNSTAHYLEAASEDMATEELAWASATFIPPDIHTGDWVSIVGTAYEIGTGRKNTALILATDENAPAAKACNEYTRNEKTDWFLPSKDELNQLYINRAKIGNMGTNAYWSSSQYSNSSNGTAWYQTFSNGDQGISYKNGSTSVRAVRAF